jgi:hypothetical protein
MNNEQQTWILRKPIKAWEYSSEELETQIPIYQYGKDDPELLTVMKDIWNEFFVEFDEVATRKQIADIITFYRTLVNGWAETGAGADDLPETALEESIDAILDVTLGRKQ